MLNRKRIAVACRRSVRLGLLALATFSVGCSADHAVEKDAGSAPSEDAGVPDARAGVPDARAGAPDASAGLRFASATATLLPVGSNDPAPLQGVALFRATQVGVDLEVTISGCSGLSPNPIEILEAGDCSQASLQAPLWKNGRGAGIATACAGFGPLRYARRGGHPDSWTIGGSRDSDVVGHVLVVHDEQSGQPLACGVIARGDDVVWTPLPPTDQPPSAAARAQLSGLCFAKQFVSNTTDACPDARALALCSSRHCDVGACAEACSEYSSCLDASGDVCQAAFQCAASAACAQCQSEILTCTLGYCAEDLSCVPPLTPDGPCSELVACCALQGEYANRCLSVFQPLSIGGDSGCFGVINDREGVGHLKAPCRFNVDVATSDGRDAGAPPRDTGQGPASAPLADDVAGTLCTSDADCPGGLCGPGPQLPGAAASEGFCTRACTTKSDCGESGLCISNGHGEGRCLGVCGSQGDCRAGFRCSGAVQLPALGSPGACLPMRPADMLADGVAGRTCSDDTDCPGGQCASRNLLGTAYPDNYCTARCYEDGACGAGGVCLVPLGSIEPGYCLLACATHEDCKREGYRCWTINDGTRLLHACYPGADPLPDHSVGLPCDDQSACGAKQAQCAKEMPYGSFSIPEIAPAPGGYCTQPCSLDEECGAGAQCVNVNTRGGLCFASCSEAAPCRDGYTCLAHLRDDNDASVCVPAPPL
jgi:hypothetical protein